MSDIRITIAYALPKRHFLKSYTVSEGTTVEEAILHSKLLEKFPNIDLHKNKVGIFSRPVTLKDTVNNGDRIEIYRPLLADPREIRRQRAKEQAMNS
ncbi:RnfH family protein [Actinobacillus delphinicola]|uniref:UPF0125 protein NCTC12871_01173 n=1 Tax=Actinobacillus delphinicola TaxID=51161 RepID=A0A448TUM0_9PAST|nr:RnfH family protein [Actinobacillus delphinicola]MDG6897815.1 RnfH family protein [Actinobacillus delphinicola]VEJ09690.1 Uncharacterised protein family (UPF0125) [Actinobacillus delphinicola]